MKQYETQRHMRRAFFEEFKIHSFNFIMLLFESVNRIIATDEKTDAQLIDEEKHARQIGNWQAAAEMAKETKGASTFVSKSGKVFTNLDEGIEQDKVQYYSKNYKRYLELRQ
jgi:hypothetical protein